MFCEQHIIQFLNRLKQNKANIYYNDKKFNRFISNINPIFFNN